MTIITPRRLLGLVPKGTLRATAAQASTADNAVLMTGHMVQCMAVTAATDVAWVMMCYDATTDMTL